jgi:hypothetical protein
MQRFPTSFPKPNTPQVRPAKAVWQMKQGETFSTDMACARDLTQCSVACVLFVGAPTRRPVTLNVEVVNAEEGVARVTADPAVLEPGIWPWTLGVVSEGNSMVCYSGVAMIEAAT